MPSPVLIMLQAMKRAQASGREDGTKASDGEVWTTTEDDTQKDIKMKPNQEGSVDREDVKLLSMDNASLEDETSFMNEAPKVMNDEVNEDRKISSPLLQQTRSQRTRTHILKLLNRGSLFFAIGLVVLVAGGVSSNFHPYVDPGEYENCTDTEQMNDTTDPNSFSNATVTESLSCYYGGALIPAGLLCQTWLPLQQSALKQQEH